MADTMPPPDDPMWVTIDSRSGASLGCGLLPMMNAVSSQLPDDKKAQWWTELIGTICGCAGFSLGHANVAKVLRGIADMVDRTAPPGPLQ